MVGRRTGRGSSRIEDLEPISPELVLVSPPEVARRARKLLSQPDDFATAARSNRRESRAPVEATSEALGTAATRSLELGSVEKSAVRGSRTRRVVGAVLVLVVIAATAAIVVRRESGGSKVSSPLARTGRDVSALFAPPRQRLLRAPKRAKRRSARSPRSSPRSQREANVKSPRPGTAGKSSRSHRNAAAKTAAFTKSARLRANASSSFTPSRVFTWPARPRATSYIVRFLRNGRGVLQLRSKRSRVAIPSSFRFAPGTYRWQVIPVVGGSRRRYLAPVVDSTFLVRRR
jgi:hypothetical protein